MGFTAIMLCGERRSGAYIGIQSFMYICVLFIFFLFGGGGGGVGWCGVGG